MLKLATYYAARPGRANELRHWARDRTASTLETRRPWWPYQAVDAVESALPATARVIEFGGGGSTLWLADRGAQVTVIEHDPEWGRALRTHLPSSATVDVVEATAEGIVRSAVEAGAFDDYVARIAEEEDDSADLVIIDGRARVACGLAALPKVRSGGILLLDDSDRPRYAPLIQAMSEWRRLDYRGAKIGGGPVFQTTVWTRP